MAVAVVVTVTYGEKKETKVSIIDKICVVAAFPIGLILLALGAIGLFTGCKAHFSLPPILGVIPALVGWGIIRSVYLAWKGPSAPATRPESLDFPEEHQGSITTHTN